MNGRRGIRIRSFRLRVALLSGLVAGVALVFFGALTYAAVYRISLRRMDEDIREFAHRHLVQPRPVHPWDRLGDALRYFAGDEDENTYILLVKGRGGAIVYQSPNWPADWPTDAFPPPGAWGDYSHLGDSSDPAAPRPGPPAHQRDRRGLPGGLPPMPLKVPEFATREAGGFRWRVGMLGNPEVTLVLGLNMRQLAAEMAPVWHAFFMVLPLVLLVIAAGSWWVAQRALRPIRDVTATIQRVKARGLDQRIAGHEEDRDFAELIAVFNDMMDWLEQSFHQAMRFSADASHELKTPLTVLQAQLEDAVQAAAPGSEEQRRYGALAEEVQRLKSITQKLLLLARMDAGELNLNRRPLDFSRLVEGMAEDTEILAPDLTVTARLAPDRWVLGDADLLRQVVQNLATNAVKFNAPGGFVRFSLETAGEEVRLTIANAGPPIPAEDQDKIFTRFWRANKARDRCIQGAGLGLSLAREIVRAHHGNLTLLQSTPEETAFALTLPATAPPAPEGSRP